MFIGVVALRTPRGRLGHQDRQTIDSYLMEQPNARPLRRQ